MKEKNMTQDPIEIAPSADISLDLTQGKSYKRIPIDVKTKVIEQGVKVIAEELGFQYNSDTKTGLRSATIYCGADAESEADVKKSAEDTLKKLNAWILFNFETILEQETGEDRSKFFRTATMFECTAENGILTLHWSE